MSHKFALNSVLRLFIERRTSYVGAGFIPARSNNQVGGRAGIRPTFNNLDRWVIQLCWEPRPYSYYEKRSISPEASR